MHKIDNIEIKNFKSIRHQKIEGCKRVNVFIGYPNVGKSNILEAIGLFAMNQEGEFDKTKNPSSPNKLVFSQICRIDEPIDLFFDKNYNEQLSVALNDKYRIQLNVSNDFSGLQFNLVMNNKSVSNYNDLTVLSTINVDTGNYWIRWHPTSGYKNDEIYNRIKSYSFNNHPQIASNDFFSLNTDGNNLAQIISTNERVRSLFISLLKSSNLKPHAITGKYGIAKELSNGLVITFDSNLIADTLKRLLFHVAAINTNKNTVLLFEEPEAHMFPPYISKFTAEVMYDGNDNQFFIATHSPLVINDFMENLKKDDYSIYTVGYDNETGETLIRRMTDEELHEIYQYGVDLFLNLENYLPHAQQQ